MRINNMRFRYLSVYLFVALALTEPVRAAKSVLEDWKDEARNRVVPVKIYLPPKLTTESPAPVVFFSHGLGGSREGYSTTANYWAEHGYVVIVLQHAGSDSGLWKDQTNPITNMLAAMNVENYMHRVKDVTFAIDYLIALNHKPAHMLSGKVDVEKIAMAGHSFGSHTTLAVAGQVAHIGTKEISVVDERIKCAIAMSPSPPQKQDDDKAFSKITIPIYYLTGTKDKVAIQPIDPAERKRPYELSTAKDQYLLVLKDGDHMLFSGRGPMAKKYTPTILNSTTAFLDAYLKNDEKAKQYLQNQYVKDLGDFGTFDYK